MWELVDMLRAAGLARSDREVSSTWLHRAPNYLADRNGAMSAETALRLYVRLREGNHGEIAEQVWRRAIMPLVKPANPRAEGVRPQPGGLGQQGNPQA